jgi:hypothetical protein
MDGTTIAVDVAKSVFEVAVSAHPGQVGERYRFSRERFRRYLNEQPPATVLMEAVDRLTTGGARRRRAVTTSSFCRRIACGPTCCATRPTAVMLRACSRLCATTRSGRSP